MKQKDCKFPKTLEYIADLLGFEKNDFNHATKAPFGGFYKRLIREIQEPETSM
jgi:hypothetical protein